MAPTRVLITGRYGFTGHYVAQEFEDHGYEVWGAGISAPKHGDTKYMQCDLSDRAGIRRIVETIRPDVVLHLAAISFVGHDNIDDFYRVNLIGTRVLLEALAQAGCGQTGVLLASSANVYGNADVMPIHEGTRPVPANDYAVSKLAMEHMALLYQDDLPIILARPFNYTGVLQNGKFLIPKIVANFRDRNAKMELGNLDVARDFSDVRDIARIYRQLIDAAPWGQVVNICSGFATPLNEIIAMCQQITGHRIATRTNPDFVRAHEIKTLMGDPARLNGLVSQGTRIPLSDTLEWMLKQTA